MLGYFPSWDQAGTNPPQRTRQKPPHPGPGSTPLDQAGTPPPHPPGPGRYPPGPGTPQDQAGTPPRTRQVPPLPRSRAYWEIFFWPFTSCQKKIYHWKDMSGRDIYISVGDGYGKDSKGVTWLHLLLSCRDEFLRIELEKVLTL